MCYVSVLFSIPNLIIWKKYKKIYMLYVRSTILFIRGHSMECRSHTNEFSSFGMCVSTQKFYVSFQNWNCRFQFYENYKNDRAKCKRKRDSIIQKFRDTIFRWNEFYYCSFSRIFSKHFWNNFIWMKIVRRLKKEDFLISFTNLFNIN